ncbi:unnamed protein product, partial [Ixodes persulcatus]
QTNQRLQLAWESRDLATATSYTAHLHIGLNEGLASLFTHLWLHIGACIRNVIAHHLLFLNFRLLLVVKRDQVTCESLVVPGILRVQHQENKVKPRTPQQRVWKLDVLNDGSVCIPLRLDRIGSCQD